MPWTCVLYDSREAARDAGGGRVPVGAMWFAPWLLDESWATVGELAPNYQRDWAGKRPPVVVKLPNGYEFCVDSRAYVHPTGHHGEGWVVTGDPPRLSVTPSIHNPGSYHGYLTDGVIGDDVEGRTFPAAAAAVSA